MPVAPGPRITTTRAVVFAVGSVLAGVALVALVIWIAGSGEVDVRLGDNQFGDIRADRLAQTIERDGPVLFPDVAGGDRDIIVTHVGDDPASGWLAFSARIPGRPRDCFLQWDPDAGDFADSCDPAIRIAADGATLPHYPVEVRDNRVIVDLQTVVAR